MSLEIRDINYSSNGFKVKTSSEISNQMPPNKYWIIDWGYYWTEITKIEYELIFEKHKKYMEEQND